MPKRQRRATTKDKGKAVATTEPTVTASNKADDTIMDPEDIRDQLAELEARQRRLSRRQENSVLKTAEAKELKDARVRIAKLKATLNDLTAPEEAGEPLITNNEESNDALCEAPGQALGLDRLPPVAHAQTKTGNKRKGLAFPKSHAKKARTATGAIIKTKSKKRDASKQHQKLIRAMLLQQDSIAAGQEMASMPILSGFAATKAGEQQKQFQALVAACQDSEEKKRMRGDKVMVNQARGALRGKYTPQDEKFLIKGMTTPLFAYQFAGSGWMVGREKSEQGPKGGILADSMGLGKTLETIACIAGNPPSRDDLALGLSRTLIVVPANAVNQWVDEIYRHGDGLLAGHYKESAKSNMAYLNKCSIWVTSYHEVSSHYPTNKFIKSQEGIESMTQEDCDAVRMKYSGPLMKMKFLRVVLDEAHAIKNHKSHTSASCLALTSKYRWALSGTPIHNRVEEIYPYMRFLDIEHTSSLYQFTRSYLPTKRNDAPDIIVSLAGLLEAVMLKRSMNTKFFGHALFKLPKPHVLEDVKVPMSREETLIYRYVPSSIRIGAILTIVLRNRRVEDKFRRRAIKEIGKAPGPGLVTNWLLYVLRLRQAVAHPFLLENLMRKEFEVEDYAWLKTQLAEVRTETPLILQIGSWCEEEHQHKSDVEHDDIDERRMMLDRMEESGNSDFMEEAEEIQDDINELCKRCGLPSDNGFQPKCGHLFCRECIENHIAAMNEGVAQGLGCRDCSKLITNIKSRTNKDSQSQKKAPENKGAKQGAWRRATASKHRGREDNVNGIQPTSSSKLESLFIQESDMKSLDKLIPSAKTIVLKNIIMDWHSRYPDDKMIIFTQFVDMGRIIGRILQKEDIDFLYFFGSMSQAKKYQAQEDFTQRPEIKVLVASLQCSGQALNLACANRVFILDLWWNYAMEQQAFGRVYRMGQNKETWRVRIMVKNTIDERMADLQAKKMAAIDAAITDHDSAKLVLTQEELAGLLGRVVFDQHGKIKDIVPDYDDESDEDDEDDDDHHRTAATTESSSQSSSNTQ
ncbi:SNF2 family N-terminal domain-containing protein [Cercophora samala]|uniref:SNF2 family N-terminal domain-containing protein n=1 Tax=Cercophora samala TaxID=330535 RepID=A0AA40D7E1_9PEZI|nr:SNF2 family N-terminal domain-containing protein [Cercophora samala]